MSNPSTHPAPEFLALQTALAGRYSLERELGRGGMGIVFLAREVALDRMVALKLLPPEMAARPGLKERFLREARTAARLSHPNIVPIYAVDEVDGFVFFAMAYVEGRTLGERIRERGPLSNAEAVRLLQEVSWALGYAHLNGLVHRDVKPENILLEEGSGRALVTDFGIAVLAKAAGTEITKEVLGTAEFMSPEQARGAEVDARSDLYSLGCVGFYALSGQVPFTGPTPASILGQHVAHPPPRLASVAPQVPPGVATALDRCLRKEPDHRFSGGEALADALSPDVQIDRELPVPLRVFVKQSRGSESTLAWSLVGQALVGVGLVGAMAGGLPGIVVGGLTLPLVALTGLPLGQLIREARRLLKTGFTQQDAVDALSQDVGRRNEEFRFQVGQRVTWVDRVARVLSVGGFGGAVAFIIAGFLGADWALNLFALPLNVGVLGALYRELRARRRGDVMGERLLRLWKGKLGKLLFKVGGLKLKRVATSVSGLHRPTEVAIGLAADRLFEELPKETRKSLKGLPETVKALEDDAQAIRHQAEELDAVLAELGDDDPSRPGSEDRARIKGQVEATRDEAREKLKDAVAALETIRLGLLHMHAGSGTVESVTMEIQAARGLSDDMENLLAGHREVERLLQERRSTGVFTDVEEEELRSEGRPPAPPPD